MLGVELERNRFFRLQVDYTQRVVFFVRSDVEFQSVEDLDRCTSALRLALPAARRGQFAMLADYRQAPLRVAPVLELAFARFLEESETGYQSFVLIVGTAIGRVRALRLAEKGKSAARVVSTVDSGMRQVTEVRLALRRESEIKRGLVGGALGVFESLSAPLAERSRGTGSKQ